jgi:hypothetical protein
MQSTHAKHPCKAPMQSTSSIRRSKVIAGRGPSCIVANNMGLATMRRQQFASAQTSSHMHAIAGLQHLCVKQDVMVQGTTPAIYPHDPICRLSNIQSMCEACTQVQICRKMGDMTWSKRHDVRDCLQTMRGCIILGFNPSCRNVCQDVAHLDTWEVELQDVSSNVFGDGSALILWKVMPRHSLMDGAIWEAPHLRPVTPEMPESRRRLARICWGSSINDAEGLQQHPDCIAFNQLCKEELCWQHFLEPWPPTNAAPLDARFERL